LSQGVASDAAGFVLAGGQSSRMGADKALVKVGGETLVERAVSMLRAAGLGASIAGKRSDLGSLTPVIEDAGDGPLCGICAALASLVGVSGTRFAVFVPVDAPFLPSSLITVLLGRLRLSDAAVALCSVAGFVETFPLALEVSLLPHLQAEEELGNRGCLTALRAASAQGKRPLAVLPVEELVQAGQVEHPKGWPPGSWFLNLNTPADLARAERVLAGNRVS
jgi:molybdenum cofactor guanylyltransferase